VQYETVSTGTTAHAESVKITFDPMKITYGRLLQIYFSVAHDPTELNRQGPDAVPNIGRRSSRHLLSRLGLRKPTSPSSTIRMHSTPRLSPHRAWPNLLPG